MLPPPKLPVLILTGFLGSGKTSLLNHLLRQWPRSAVLINEFGATSVDQRLIERHDIPMSVLAGGCLCCQVRDALAPTLKNLWMAWNGQGQRAFERLIIEASGVASPEPVLDVLLRERWLAPRLQLQGVVTTLAVPTGEEQLARFSEAQAQVAWADALVLTQADLADPRHLRGLEARLAAVVPDTPRLSAIYGNVDPEQLLACAATGFQRVPAGTVVPDHGFHGISLRLESPIPWPCLRSALETLLERYGARLVRVKGVVYLPDDPRPVVLQAAWGRLHPPMPLASRVSDDGIGRLNFISDGLIDSLAGELMEAIRGGAKSATLTSG